MKKIAIFSVVMILGASAALAETLNVPFYRDGDDGALDSQGFIGIKNTTTDDQTLTIIYTSLNASLVPADWKVTAPLAANTSVSWRPVSSADTGPLSVLIPNNELVGPDGTNVSIVGSASIKGIGLKGRYIELLVTLNSAFGHALIND